MEQKAWVVAVDMGYGHQRAAYPLRGFSPTGKVVIANNYPGIPKKDHYVWKEGRSTYEFFSRTTNIPYIGKYLFKLFLDNFQAIAPFYPRRDLSKPSIQVKEQYRLIRRGFGKDLIEQLNKENIPLITTFFTVAFMAEEHGFKNEIYLVICDSDISRTWVVERNVGKSRIKYLAPCRRVVERLKLYGVPEKNIFLTGFPLPDENLGVPSLKMVKTDLAQRLIKLDPENRYRNRYGDTVKKYLKIKAPVKVDRLLTLTFAVGGAGAQKTIAKEFLFSLKRKIQENLIAVNLVAGSRDDVYSYFKKIIIETGLEKKMGENLNIIFAPHKEDYFKIFNETLRTTDILWTKPSELVFYSALGLPIIIAPPVGSQEDFNLSWLKNIRAGIEQGDPRYTHEWLFDSVNSGWLAEAAMSGFLDGRQFGVTNIADVVFRGINNPADDDELI